jgi:hypothetical protein
VLHAGVAAGAIPPIGGKPSPAEVETLVAQIEGGSGQAASTLARHCRISPDTAARIVQDAGGEALVIAFKSLGQSRLAMAKALQRWLASPACPVNGEERLVELHATFDSLSFNKARMILAYWDWAARDAGPFTVFKA